MSNVDTNNKNDELRGHKEKKWWATRAQRIKTMSYADTKKKNDEVAHRFYSLYPRCSSFLFFVSALLIVFILCIRVAHCFYSLCPRCSSFLFFVSALLIVFMLCVTKLWVLIALLVKFWEVFIKFVWENRVVQSNMDHSTRQVTLGKEQR
jgi:hypothetical protein